MLFNRYANPYMLLNQMIETGQLSDFINEFMDAIDERISWEFYLLKVTEKISFDDYRKSIKQPVISHEPVEKDSLETTVKRSIDILNNFVV